MKHKFIKFAAAALMLGAFAALFGCVREKKNELPFDAEKAYHYKRPGLISGAGYEICPEKEGIVKVFSYAVPAPEYEDGMKDLGADIYFVGISPGEVLITVTEYSPVDDPIESSFILSVDKNLQVSVKD